MINNKFRLSQFLPLKKNSLISILIEINFFFFVHPQLLNPIEFLDQVIIEHE